MYGAKLVLILSYGSSTASYALTGMSHSMPMIYVSRMPTLLQVRPNPVPPLRGVLGPRRVA